LDWIEKSGVIVQSLRRRVGNSRGYSKLEPHPDTVLHLDDIVVLSGNANTLAQAQKQITKVTKLKAKT